MAPVEACIQLLIEEPQTACIGHAMAEDDVRTIMADPDVMVASDASSMSPTGPLGAAARPSPQLRDLPPGARPFVREGVLTLETAIRKMTSLPADRFGLPKRGRIVEGAVADLVVLDPAGVRDRATFDAPHAFPDGIRAVVVDGAIAWSADGRPVGLRRDTIGNGALRRSYAARARSPQPGRRRPARPLCVREPVDVFTFGGTVRSTA